MTKLKEFADKFSSSQFIYSSGTRNNWEERDSDWKNLVSEIERVEKLLIENNITDNS